MFLDAADASDRFRRDPQHLPLFVGRVAGGQPARRLLPQRFRNTRVPFAGFRLDHRTGIELADWGWSAVRASCALHPCCGRVPACGPMCRRAHPELRQAIARGREYADSHVAERLYNRAVGYEREAVRIFNGPDGPGLRAIHRTYSSRRECGIAIVAQSAARQVARQDRPRDYWRRWRSFGDRAADGLVFDVGRGDRRDRGIRCRGAAPTRGRGAHDRASAGRGRRESTVGVTGIGRVETLSNAISEPKVEISPWLNPWMPGQATH